VQQHLRVRRAGGGLAEVRFSGDWLPGWQAGTLGPSRPTDSAARLAELSVPILLLHGRRDLLFPAALAESAAEVLPTAQAVVLDDAAHMAHIDQPDAWLAALRHFPNHH
jgi:pimeloyl-ACP methyl ester carboxylesterase